LVIVEEPVGGAACAQRLANRCEITMAKSALSGLGPHDRHGARQPWAAG
jgi:hypothetical protein